MQLAALFGVYALSLLAVIAVRQPFGDLRAAADSRLGGGRGAVALACAFVLLLGLGYVWGERRLASAPQPARHIRLRIVQANIDQANKWRPENSAEIFTDYLDLTKSRRRLRRHRYS